MAVSPVVVAVLVGVVQGVVEWLPISSEGTVALVLTATGVEPTIAVQYALFLHAGTALAATVYYRADLREVLHEMWGWRPRSAFDPEYALVSFLVGATLISGVVAISAYVVLLEVASALAGGAFIALIGGLLILTGILQRSAAGVVLEPRSLPDWLDVVLVGIGQGLAILPGISRSGTTASFLLLRGVDGEAAFRLSFILSIPAALGAGGLSVLDVGGLPGLEPGAAGLALLASAMVGLVTIDALMRVVRRIRFWLLCLGLGSLAVIGGALVLLV